MKKNKIRNCIQLNLASENPTEFVRQNTNVFLEPTMGLEPSYFIWYAIMFKPNPIQSVVLSKHFQSKFIVAI